MASYNHHTQEASLLKAGSQYESQIHAAQQSSSSRSKLIYLYEKALPALPDADADEDVESNQSGGEIPSEEIESESLEDTDNKRTNSEIKSEDYEQMLNDCAYSSTHISSWGYGIYWTRRGNSQDTGFSCEESFENRGDSDAIDFQNGTNLYQPESGTPIHEQHVSLYDADSQTDAADCDDNEQQESDCDGVSVQTHSSSSSTELSTCDYGPETASSPGTILLEDPAPSTLSQVSFEDIIQRGEDEQEFSSNESTNYSPRTPQLPTWQTVPITPRQRKLTFLPPGYIPMSNETPKIKLPSPHEMTRPPSMLKRLFSKSTTPTSLVPEKRPSTSRRPKEFQPFHDPISRKSTDYVIVIPSSRELVSGKMGHVVMQRKRSMSLPSLIHERR